MRSYQSSASCDACLLRSEVNLCRKYAKGSSNWGPAFDLWTLSGRVARYATGMTTSEKDIQMLRRKLLDHTFRTFFTAFFLLIVVGAVGVLAEHTYTPAPRDNVAKDWPAESSLKLDDSKLTCIVFVHPHCPCSGSTLTQLLSVSHEAPHLMQLTFVFVLPHGVDADWEKGNLWKRLNEHPEVARFVDKDAREANLFNANTSGHVFLFNPAGSRRFDGGVTPGRGQIGPSDGLSALLAVANNPSAPPIQSLVYGCLLSQ